MMGGDIHTVLAEIQAGAREGRAWRERAETRLDQTAESLNLLSQAVAEIGTEMKLHLHYGQERIDRLETRLANIETPRAAATQKAAVAVGGGGLFGWLAGGGWDHLALLLKRILP